MKYFDIILKKGLVDKLWAIKIKTKNKQTVILEVRTDFFFFLSNCFDTTKKDIFILSIYWMNEQHCLFSWYSKTPVWHSSTCNRKWKVRIVENGNRFMEVVSTFQPIDLQREMGRNQEMTIKLSRCEAYWLNNSILRIIYLYQWAWKSPLSLIPDSTSCLTKQKAVF